VGIQEARGPATLLIPPGGSEASCVIGGIHVSHPGPSRYTGTVDRLTRGSGEVLSSVRFHVVNFGARGAVIQDDEGHRWTGRNVLEGGGWRVLLDWLGPKAYPRPRKPDGSLGESVLEREGYEITHVGSLQRLDDASFTAADTRPVLDLLFWLLTFARGRWCGVLLPVGLDVGGERVWEQWGVPKVHQRTPTGDQGSSWYLPDSEALGLTFPMMVSQWSDPAWQEVLRLAIDLYATANVQSSSSIALVIAQATLELLAWAVLVERQQVISRTGFKKLETSATLKRLLDNSGIPIEIPAGLPKLSAEAADRQWENGPHVITSLRNAVVHPTWNRHTGLGIPDLPWQDAARLSLWYVELILLRFLEYAGPYRNRLTFSEETVPWVGQGRGKPDTNGERVTG